MQIVESELRPPARGEARLKVLAAAVSRPDVTVRSGHSLYGGTPLGQRLPLTPGYAVIGEVDAVGEGVTAAAPGDRVGVLCVVGGYSEYLYWRSDRLIPVPAGLHPVEAAPLILNYIVAYQALHRSVKARPGETALIIGASGGIGTALLQLGQLAGLKMYALASPGKHGILAGYGAVPIDYRAQDFAEIIRRAEPDGIDVVLDGMTRPEMVHRALGLLRRGGRLVSFGEPDGFASLLRVLGMFAATNLLRTGKSCAFYGTSFYFLGDRKPFMEDWAELFRLLAAGQIRPVIARKFPLLEAAAANRLLESGQVVGNLVLAAPEIL